MTLAFELPDEQRGLQSDGLHFTFASPSAPPTRHYSSDESPEGAGGRRLLYDLTLRVNDSKYAVAIFNV